jgi:chromosome segregation ATPase
MTKRAVSFRLENDPSGANSALNQRISTAHNVVQSQFTVLTQRETTLTDNAKSLQDDIEECQRRESRLKEYAEELTIVRDSIATKRATFEESQARESTEIDKSLAEAEAAISDLNHQIEAIGRKRSAVITQSREAFERSEKVSALEASADDEIEGLTAKIGSMNEAVISKTVSKLQAQIGTERQQLSLSEREIGEAQSHIVALKKKSVQVKAKKSDLAMRKEDLEVKLLRAQEGNIAAEQAIRAKQSAAASIHAKKAERKQHWDLLRKTAENAIPRLRKRLDDVSRQLAEVTELITKDKLEIDCRLSGMNDAITIRIQKRADLTILKSRWGKRRSRWDSELGDLTAKRRDTVMALGRMRGELQAMHDEEIKAQDELERLVIESSRVREIDECLDDAAHKLLLKEEDNSMADHAARAKLESDIRTLEELQQQIADARVENPQSDWEFSSAVPVGTRSRNKRALRTTRLAIKDLKRQLRKAREHLGRLKQQLKAMENDQRDIKSMQRDTTLKREISTTEMTISRVQEIEHLGQVISGLETRMKRRRCMIDHKREQHETRQVILARVLYECGPARQLSFIQSELNSWKSEFRHSIHSLLSLWLEKLDRDFPLQLASELL